MAKTPTKLIEPTPGETDHALSNADTPADTATDRGTVPPARVEARDQPGIPPKGLTPGDEARKAMMSRFRSNRRQDAADADADRFFAGGGMPPEVLPGNPDDPDANADVDEINRFVEQERRGQPQDGDDGDGAPADGGEPAVTARTEALPKTVKLKVHGKEVEITIDEAIAEAQKSLAATNLLEDARAESRKAQELLRDIQSRGATDPRAQDQSAQSGRTEAPAATEEDENQILIDTVEHLQIGSKEEAAAKLKAILDARDQRLQSRTTQQSQQAVLQQRLVEEDGRANAAYAAFEQSNAALLNDETHGKDRRRIIESEVYDQQLADLKKLGKTDEDLQREIGRVPTPNDIAAYHRFLRAQSPGSVRPLSQIFVDSRDEALKRNPHWAATETEPTPGKNRKVEVQLDRDGRRAVIQRQPTRASAPRAPVVSAQTQETNRQKRVEAIIADRRKARGSFVSAR